MEAIVKSGLYDASESIHCCIVTDSHPTFEIGLPKMKPVVVGHPNDYERPTLLYLQKMADEDTEDVYYWYIHTKGLRWFGTEREQNVLDWIHLLLHWNINSWKDAIQALDNGYDTYGCNQTHEPVNHYSGNFWWTRSSYLRSLPRTIGNGYNDPEFWILRPENAKWYCVFRSGLEGMGHYTNRYPKDLYVRKT